MGVALLSVAVAVVSVFQLATWDDDDDDEDEDGDPSFSNTVFVVFVSMVIVFTVLLGALGADLSYIRYVLTNQGFSFLPARYGVRSRFANPALNLDDSDEELSSETATDLRTGLQDSDEYSE